MSDSVIKRHGLTRRQHKAIPLILQAKTITEGCAGAGITRQTFYEWYRNNDFRMEFIKQRQEIIDLALHELKTSASEAVNVLRELLNSDSEVIKFRTSSSILDHISRFLELENIEERLTAIEKKVNKQG